MTSPQSAMPRDLPPPSGRAAGDTLIRGFSSRFEASHPGGSETSFVEIGRIDPLDWARVVTPPLLLFRTAVFLFASVEFSLQEFGVGASFLFPRVKDGVARPPQLSKPWVS